MLSRLSFLRRRPLWYGIVVHRKGEAVYAQAFADPDQCEIAHMVAIQSELSLVAPGIVSMRTVHAYTRGGAIRNLMRLRLPF